MGSGEPLIVSALPFSSVQGRPPDAQDLRLASSMLEVWARIRRMCSSSKVSSVTGMPTCGPPRMERVKAGFNTSGRSSTSIWSPLLRMTACSTTLRNSRRFPGQGILLQYPLGLRRKAVNPFHALASEEAEIARRQTLQVGGPFTQRRKPDGDDIQTVV